MQIFVYTDLNDRLKDLLKKESEAIVFNNPEDRDTSIKSFRASVALLGNPPGEWFNEIPSGLRFWQLDSAGFDQYKHIKTDAVVANMGDFFSLKCAETIVGGLLTMYRCIHDMALLQQEKRWIGKPLRYRMDMLSGKKVIILGAGTIAQSIKKLLTGFDCEVKFVARTNPLAEIRTNEELLRRLPQAEIVINTLPGSVGTFVTGEIFEAMRNETVYASVGRGTTTDERALVQALVSGKLSGAVLDVTEKEPLPVSSPLWEMKNVILTQHTGGGYKFEDEGKVQQFLLNLDRFKKGEAVQNKIDLSQGY